MGFFRNRKSLQRKQIIQINMVITQLCRRTPFSPRDTAYRQGRAGRWLVLLYVLCLACLSGCTTTNSMLRLKSPAEILAMTDPELSLTNDHITERTTVLLRTCDLEKKEKVNRQEAIDTLEPLANLSAKPDVLFALCELCFKEGRQLEKQNMNEPALKLYVQCLIYSYRFLFDQKYAAARNSYDPAFRDMCVLYNGASDRILRLTRSWLCYSQPESIKSLPFIESVKIPLGPSGESMNLEMKIKALNWTPDDIAEIQFSSDYDVTGLHNRYRQYGLGAPMMILRRFSPEDPTSKYSPNVQYFPSTAIIRPNLSAFDAEGDSLIKGKENACHLTVEYYDSVQQSLVEIDRQEVPLESDWSAALAASMNDLQIKEVGSVGLFNPDKLMDTLPGSERTIKGFYMPQPYDPNKIPVVMVHGLWSSPITWLDMFNTLRTIPEIRKKYQFWFYLYPNGQPFWVSSAQFRTDLAEIRQTLDPHRRHRVFDQMVLIGHSMGGLISQMQTIDSGENLWSVVSRQPIDQFSGSEEMKRNFKEWFYFHYNTSIHKVIFLATPHKGSEMSNFSTRSLGRTFIRQASTVQDALKELLAGRNQELLSGSFLQENQTGVDSLSSESPFFPAMNRCVRSPYVEYHSIIGIAKPSQWESKIQSDGVVSSESAHLDGAKSEFVVQSLHTEITHNPAAIMEVGRILLKNSYTYK